MRSQPLAAVASVLAALGLFACHPEVRPTGPGTPDATSAAGQRLDAERGAVWSEEFEREELETRRLEKLWDVYLGERIAKMWQLGDALYVYTEQGRLYAVGLADGLVRWQYRDILSGIDFAPGAYDYEVDEAGKAPELYLLSRDVLHVLDRQHGYLLWKLELPFAASSPASGNDSHVYVGSWDDRVYAVSKDGYVDWWYRTGAPVTAAAEPSERAVESVFVASEDGAVYSMNPVREQRKWAVQTGGTLTCSPLFYRSHVYVASQDMTFYCLRSADGGIAWKYPTGAQLSRKPLAYERDLAYIIDDGHRLLAINLQPDVAGEYLRWSRDGVRQVLAHGRGDVYVLDRPSGLVALDEATGSTRWESALEVGADYYVQSPFSAKSRRKAERDLSTIMVFGYQSGWLHAIKEKGEY